jgi:hypothetical protein
MIFWDKNKYSNIIGILKDDNLCYTIIIEEIIELICHNWENIRTNNFKRDKLDGKWMLLNIKYG